ncbi:MAG: M20/M25/M40 family metallo-hydrolase [Bacteroidales bacterium]|nr:M20/M25/M40 family metallo-hydrolase [Bacteroidales bacterium]
MNRIIIYCFSLPALLLLLISCKPRFEKEILRSEIESHIRFLASDSLKGRYPGTPEERILSEYITGEMKKAGLILFGKSGLQKFPVVNSIKAGEHNSFAFDGHSYQPAKDFQPLPFSGNDTISGEIAFAGYGFRFSHDSLSWDDYSDLSAEGKIMLILKGNPESSESGSSFVNYSNDRDKALLASDLGAAGVILVSGTQYDPEDNLPPLKGKEHRVSIPVLQVKRYLADTILKKAKFPSIDELEQQIKSSGPSSFLTGQMVHISTELIPEEVETFNTISMLKGSDPVLRNQYVLIGAHHDHLGWGGKGSGSRMPDTTAVHFGADDNASGVSGILEIAEKLVSIAPRRSVIFTTFGAEEMGLIGSRYLVENLPVEPDSIQAMINLDMVGRLNEEKQLQVSGVGTSPLFEKILDSLNFNYGFKLKLSSEGYGPSDHAAFYAKDIPVIFISTGAHTDYHTPADSYDKINFNGSAEVYYFVAELVEALANYPDKIPFTEAGPKVRTAPRGGYGKITLGIMPDMNYDGDEGMPVLFVNEGRPAAMGGMKKGDIITAIDGKKVGNIYDYMSRLGQLEEGQSVIVTVKRENDTLQLLIQL